MEIRITNGLSEFYVRELDTHDFELHRIDIGIEGPWNSYFNLLKRAILKENNGKLELIKEEDESVSLKIHYPISENAKLTGVFEIGEISQEEIPKLIQKLLFELEGKNEKQKKLYEKKIEDIKKAYSMPQVAGPAEEMKEVENGEQKPKRKFKANLVNPNTKKRKAKGAKFGGGK